MLKHLYIYFYNRYVILLCGSYLILQNKKKNRKNMLYLLIIFINFNLYYIIINYINRIKTYINRSTKSQL